MNQEKLHRENELLKCICSLPQKMLKVHGIDNLTEFLLHSLAHQNCFNFSKAAYFVDNPDFDHLKGVSGIISHEQYPHDEHWEHPDAFSSHMETAPFNQKVRSIAERSIHRNDKKHDDVVRSLSEELSFDSPLYRTWDMKYDNKGLIIFEPREDERDFMDQHLDAILHLFSFCPVF